MSTNRSDSLSILLIGEEIHLQNSFEYQKVSDSSEAVALIKSHEIKLIILNQLNLDLALARQLYKEIHLQDENVEFVVVLRESDGQSLNPSLIALLNPLSILSYGDLSTDALSKEILNALKKYDYHKQNENFYTLFEEQNANLQKLNRELKAGVEKRKAGLMRSQTRLLKLQQQLSLMYECIVGVQNVKSISEIEELLVQILSGTMNAPWVRILIDQKEILDEVPIIENQKHFFVFGSALIFDKNKIGHIYFAKKNKPFNKGEESFLLQISEIVSIKINQLIKYSKLLITRSQWQETFKAIKYPVVILNKNYDYITSNQTHLEVKSQTRKKCYQVLFNADKPCAGCQFGQKFEFKEPKDNRWYYVTSQSLKEYYDDSENLIHIYQDVTEQKNIETQIIEKTKLSDLGILAGSLAHELNNPLGGIITFLQLLLEDVDENLKGDIQDLLNSANTCKEIIQMILENVRHNKPLTLT